MIIGSIFDRGTSAQNTNVTVLFIACDVGYGDEGKRGKKKGRVEFRTAVCSWERMGGFPGAKIVRGEAKNYLSASPIKKLVFYPGIA